MEVLQDGEMDDALRKAQELVMDFQSLQDLKEKMTQRISKEEDAHAKTQELLRTQSEKLTTLCQEREDTFEALRRERADTDKARRDHEMEAANHAATRSEAKAQVDGERAAHQATREALDMARGETVAVQNRANEQLSNMQQENEMLRAQLQSYESRCVAADAKLAEAEKDNERLHQAHAVTKSSLQSALQAQEAYRKEYHATHQELQAVRVELQATRDELSTQSMAPANMMQAQEEVARLRSDLEALTRVHQETKTQLDTVLQEKHMAEQNVALVNQALQEREQQLSNAKMELDTTKAKAKEICNLVNKVSPRR